MTAQPARIARGKILRIRRDTLHISAERFREDIAAIATLATSTRGSQRARWESLVNFARDELGQFCDRDHPEDFNVTELIDELEDKALGANHKQRLADLAGPTAPSPMADPRRVQLAGTELRIDSQTVAHLSDDAMAGASAVVRFRDWLEDLARSEATDD